MRLRGLLGLVWEERGRGSYPLACYCAAEWRLGSHPKVSASWQFAPFAASTNCKNLPSETAGKQSWKRVRGTGDPPVYAFYSEPRGPLPAGAKPGRGIHHMNFGTYLKEGMEKLAVESIVRRRDEGESPGKEAVKFFVRHLCPGTAP